MWIHLWTRCNSVNYNPHPFRHPPTMADNDRARQRIIASVFDKRNAAQDVLESYVAHIKIWEDTGEGQGRKPRYILISRPCPLLRPIPAHLHSRRYRQLRFHTQVKAQYQRHLLRRQDLEARRAQRHPDRQRACPPLFSPSTHPPTVGLVQHHPCEDVQMADR